MESDGLPRWNVTIEKCLQRLLRVELNTVIQTAYTYQPLFVIQFPVGFKQSSADAYTQSYLQSSNFDIFESAF